MMKKCWIVTTPEVCSDPNCRRTYRSFLDASKTLRIRILMTKQKHMPLFVLPSATPCISMFLFIVRVGGGRERHSLENCNAKAAAKIP